MTRKRQARALGIVTWCIPCMYYVGMRTTIYLPDDLANQVREHNLPVSNICQTALRNEVNRIVISTADDIQVYFADEHEDPDPHTWPGFDPAKPTLIWQPVDGPHHAWVLLYDDPDTEPGANPSDYPIGGERDDVAFALDAARQWLRVVPGTPMARIVVQVGEPAHDAAFEGRWLVEPDPDYTRSDAVDGGHDAGAYWGVALTKRGRFAVYVAHCNERWAASLDVYDTFDAAAGKMPADIAAVAAAQLGESKPVELDI